ncbi:MAG: 2-oxoacid:acceptor oxidoreductase family protein [Anaerolineae bacterium]
MGKMIEIRWHARGGQGAVTAGKLLAETALGAGLYFQAFPDYGAERMGAPIRAYTRLSDSPITVHSPILEPDVVIVLDPTLLGVVDVAEGLKENGVLLFNTTESPTEVRKRLNLENKNVRIFTVDASTIAIQELGREITNTPMLGAFCTATGLLDLNKIVEQVRKDFGKKMRPDVVEANVRAIQRAAQEVQQG